MTAEQTKELTNSVFSSSFASFFFSTLTSSGFGVSAEGAIIFNDSFYLFQLIFIFRKKLFHQQFFRLCSRMLQFACNGRVDNLKILRKKIYVSFSSVDYFFFNLNSPWIFLVVFFFVISVLLFRKQFN